MEDKKYQIDTTENRNFLEGIRKNLWEFGQQFPSPGGSAYYLGDDGTPWKERDRETWITCRMIHVYCLGSLMGQEKSEKLVDQALKGLSGELKDEQYGGWYPGRTAKDEILPGKKCYEHAFVILAATSAVLAKRPGAGELLEEALKTYDRYFWDKAEGLACDNWDSHFTKMDDYRGINANMHTVEAFLAVADVTGREKYRQRAGSVIRHVVGWAEKNNWRLPEHFTKDWKPDFDYHRECPDDPFKPYGATPGHGIEWARLILQWVLSAYPEDKAQQEVFTEKAEQIYGRAIADGWYVDGEPGIIYTTDWNGKPVVHDRMHWTLAEAINTSALLYHVTQKEKYRTQYETFMEYLDQTVLDHEKGSWLHQLDEKNQLKETVWPGKSDLYHALQSTLIPYCTPEVSVAVAVKRKILDTKI